VQRKEVTKPFERNKARCLQLWKQKNARHERATHWFNLDILLCNIFNTKTRYRIHGL